MQKIGILYAISIALERFRNVFEKFNFTLTHSCTFPRVEKT